MKAFRKGNSQREFHQSFRSQSAMEYLMTYGWAILIIAVVLAALFELGVFNPMTFAPKATPGSCQVVRPDGPGTTNFISLEGECNNEILQYAAGFSQSPAGYIHAPLSIQADSQITVTFWIDPINNRYWGVPGDYWENVVSGSNGIGCWGSYYFYIESGSNPPAESWSVGNARDFPGTRLTPNKWQMLVGTFNGTYLKVYLNGQLIGSPVATSGATTSVSDTATISGTTPVSSGSGCNPISGNLANVQIYNTALSANDIKALYREGIGGAPIKIQSLVGWWPLNGNANDYSGNGNNGVASGVTYTTNWYSGYSAP